MANWNGSYFEENSHNHAHFGIGLGLPAGFPINAMVGRQHPSMDIGGDSAYHPHETRELTNVQHLHVVNASSPNPSHAFHSPSELFNSRENTMMNPNNSYPWTDLNLASIAANSTLTATAGEFIPRSHSAQNVSRPQGLEVPAPSPISMPAPSPMSMPAPSPMSMPAPLPQSVIKTNQKPEQHNVPMNKRQDARFCPPRSQGLPNRRVSFPTQRRSGVNMDDAKTQDRRRLLAEAAAFLTSTSNQEPSIETRAPSTSSPRELHRDVESFPKGRTEDNVQATKEGATNRHFVGPSNTNNARYSGKYDNNSSRRGGGNNWRGSGAGGSVTAEETFTSSRNYQGRHGNAPPVVNQPSPRRKTFHMNVSNKDDTASQREKLSQQLSRGTLECLVCCEHIRQLEPVWSCAQCYHVLHLRCIKKWAFTSKAADNGWRCPACQNVTSKIPTDYFCFCGKVRDPDWNRQEVAHTCGEVCNKSLAFRKADCVHRCILLCHPGPCPPCAAQTKRQCGCGKMTQLMKCGGDTVLLCEATCDKDLNCGLHSCQKTCHVRECGVCEKKVDQVCHCGKENRQVECTTDTHSTFLYCCGKTCERLLSCSNHKCTMTCHEGPCDECQLTPAVVKYCPCGKSELKAPRTSCLDEIPTCGETCSKKLKCGQPNSPHECQVPCHAGPCPPCPQETLVRCRCGNMDKEIPCVELTTKADDARCTKKCTKKRACGKHRCNQMCCIDLDHVCPLVCNHQLSCGRHRCEELCHRGHCKPCWRISWEEHYCECRKTVQMPPIPCGTRPPDCPETCSRQHACEHPPQHNCHSFAACPPCSVLTSKWCYGNHQLRTNVPCYLTEVSCGLPCNKPLGCPRNHNCNKPCHQGPCLRPGEKCTQPCTNIGSICGHKCGLPCHPRSCPWLPCKEMVKVTCECGHRSATVPCADQQKEYERVARSLLASQIADVQLGNTINIGDLSGGKSIQKINNKTLECTEECKVIERNRRLAIGLQIRNPDLSAKLTPRYSEFMRGWAKKDSHFCQQIHNKLTELVQLAKQSKQKSRSYSFEPMNRDKRHFVHEYCEHFGCESEAYDPEPKRNVVATAVKEKAWLPSMSLMEVIQRENGIRKIPKPVTNFANLNAATITTNSPSSSGTAWRRALPAASTSPQVRAPDSTPTEPTPAEREPIIDYFDFTTS